MSAFLITSSLATTLLIPAEEFERGGEASGRALAYLAHTYLGDAPTTREVIRQAEPDPQRRPLVHVA